MNSESVLCRGRVHLSYLINCPGSTTWLLSIHSMDFLSLWHWPVPPNDGNDIFFWKEHQLLVIVWSCDKSCGSGEAGLNVIHTLKAKHKNQLSIKISGEMGTRSVTFPRINSMPAHLLFYPEVARRLTFLLLCEHTAHFISFSIHREQDLSAIWESILHKVKRLWTAQIGGRNCFADLLDSD